MGSKDPVDFKDKDDFSALKNALRNELNPIFRAAAAEALGEKGAIDALDAII